MGCSPGGSRDTSTAPPRKKGAGWLRAGQPRGRGWAQAAAPRGRCGTLRSLDIGPSLPAPQGHKDRHPQPHGRAQPGHGHEERAKQGLWEESEGRDGAEVLWALGKDQLWLKSRHPARCCSHRDTSLCVQGRAVARKQARVSIQHPHGTLPWQGLRVGAGAIFHHRCSLLYTRGPLLTWRPK